jgi:DNA-binding GntR family transcriptional regulator
MATVSYLGKWAPSIRSFSRRNSAPPYRPRQPIPSEHQLVQDTELSRSTVQKALRHLRDAGAIHSVQGLGNFVSEDQAK